MLHESPLQEAHAAYARQLVQVESAHAGAHRPGAAVGQKTESGLEYIPFGVASADGGPTCQIVASYGDVEPEYAAIRRGAAILDSPHRGTILITGKDRRDFLNRMVTQELKDMHPSAGPGGVPGAVSGGAGVARQAFWLNRKGRIEADLLLLEQGESIIVDVDIHQAEQTVRTLQEFIFAEDVALQNVSAQYEHLAVHGPRAGEAVSRAMGVPSLNLLSLQGTKVSVAGAGEVSIIRRDQTGEDGYELMVPIESAHHVWKALLNADQFISQGKRRVRPIGWHAFNIARIEAGTPLFNIDFGPSNLPHETGVLRERISFTKGCYLGQEVVARMESRGHSKSQLVGLRMLDDHLPVADGQVFDQSESGAMGEPIGVITSSTLSPMLGAAPIAFGMIKSSKAVRGSRVLVNAEGAQVQAEIQGLRFWPPEDQAANPPAHTASATSSGEGA